MLKETVGAMLGHEEFKLFIQQLAITDAIHHLSSFQELQPSFPSPAEAAPHHDLGLVLDSLPCELGSIVVRASRPPAACFLASKH
jgi:hypothetical protein